MSTIEHERSGAVAAHAVAVLPTPAVHIALSKKFLLSAVSATAAETVTFPLDLTKTRMMLAARSGQQASAGMVATASMIVRKEGVRYLWRGCPPALLRQIIYSGSRLCLYEVLRDSVFKKDSDGTFSSWKAASCGLLAGALGQAIASPTDLVKVRLAGQGMDAALGKPLRYKGTYHAFSTIVKEEGFLGLWKGCIPNVQRAAVVNVAELATYDKAKQAYRSLVGDNPVSHALASLTSSFIAALAGTPADLVKTRVMYQPVVNGRGTLYRGSFDCLRQTIKNEGLFSLWRGMLPVWLRMAPWSMVFWLTYEQMRRFGGLDSF
eukprot:m.29436 g.29436  ORF g.29436 m.29436 type:complete len:321 (-) comp10528_c0_seq1:317-1279(-)